MQGRRKELTNYDSWRFSFFSARVRGNVFTSWIQDDTPALLSKLLNSSYFHPLSPKFFLCITLASVIHNEQHTCQAKQINTTSFVAAPTSPCEPASALRWTGTPRGAKADRWEFSLFSDHTCLMSKHFTWSKALLKMRKFFFLYSSTFVKLPSLRCILLCSCISVTVNETTAGSQNEHPTAAVSLNPVHNHTGWPPLPGIQRKSGVFVPAVSANITAWRRNVNQ